MIRMHLEHQFNQISMYEQDLLESINDDFALSVDRHMTVVQFNLHTETM
jgi:hypothetical protein